MNPQLIPLAIFVLVAFFVALLLRTGHDKFSNQTEASARATRLQIRNDAASRIAFVDVETTGLSPEQDRIVSCAVVLLELAPGGKTLAASPWYVIFNPGRQSHPQAREKHGYSENFLARQPQFSTQAAEIERRLTEVDCVVCHNAQFDLAFINNELARAGFRKIKKPSMCTMEQARELLGTGRLDLVLAQYGMSRLSARHGALEDAWLTMNVFLRMNGYEENIPFTLVPESSRKPHNERGVCA